MNHAGRPDLSGWAGAWQTCGRMRRERSALRLDRGQTHRWTTDRWSNSGQRLVGRYAKDPSPGMRSCSMVQACAGTALWAWRSTCRFPSPLEGGWRRAPGHERARYSEGLPKHRPDLLQQRGPGPGGWDALTQAWPCRMLALVQLGRQPRGLMAVLAGAYLEPGQAAAGRI